MPRGKRGVKFPHKGNNGHAADGRRSSFSDYSEDGSPIKQRSGSGQQAPLDGIAEQPPQSPAEAAAEEKRVAHEKRKTDFKVRTFWTFVMFAGFFTALFSGHIYIICVMTVIQVVSFKEVIAIASVPSRARQLRPSKSLNWYWLATTMYFLYGESVIYYFKHIVLVDKVLLPLATHHRFISFFLYIFGFVFFVTTLHAGHFKFQFTQFAWTHMALYLIVVQAHFVMNNVFEGLIWFFLPASLVITNDIFAYIVGMTFGRTQLIKLSPKKTVEGFVGAWVFTIVFGIIIANILTRSSYFICPAHDLAANIFTGLECTPNPAFLPKTYSLPDLVFLPPNTDISFTVAPIQFHTLVLATFASLIAPFGGFFASGLKRTFKIKDFGDSIPGHGGMTDRMDCQFIMGFFTYIYFHTFVSLNKEASLGAVMELAITGLTLDEQKELITGLGRYLSNQGLINGEALSECLDKSLQHA